MVRQKLNRRTIFLCFMLIRILVIYLTYSPLIKFNILSKFIILLFTKWSVIVKCR